MGDPSGYLIRFSLLLCVVYPLHQSRRLSPKALMKKLKLEEDEGLYFLPQPHHNIAPKDYDICFTLTCQRL